MGAVGHRARIAAWTHGDNALDDGRMNDFGLGLLDRFWFAVEAIDAVELLIIDDFAGFESDDAFAEVIDDAFVVGSDEQGGTEVVDALQKLDDFGLGKFVEVAGWFVGD